MGCLSAQVAPRCSKILSLRVLFTRASSVGNLIWYAWIICNRLYIVVYCRLPLTMPALCEWELDRGYLSCIASGYVIKFTDEIGEKKKEKKNSPCWSQNHGSLNRKCWAAHSAGFSPNTGLMLPQCRNHNGCKGGQGRDHEILLKIYDVIDRLIQLSPTFGSCVRRGENNKEFFFFGLFFLSCFLPTRPNINLLIFNF